MNIINLPPKKVWIRKEYLRDLRDGHGEYVKGWWVSLKSIWGKCFYFETYIPKEKPNHLLGIGDLPSLERTIPLGIDTFDSSYPTRAARHGHALTSDGAVKILRKMHENTLLPLEEGCSCYTCKHYSRAFLHHLFKAKELSGYTLLTIHNLHFMVELMRLYREKILNDLI